MVAKIDDILAEVSSYYSAKLADHGATPRGVDWNSAAGQALRFEQLLKIVEPLDRISVNDLGCGYGALLDHLDARFENVSYFGYDIAPAMLDCARQRFSHRDRAQFKVSASPDVTADYGIASGLFNVRQSRSDSEWEQYLQHTLHGMRRTSRRGFAFNCLTSYTDIERRPDLYYVNPCVLFDFCKRQFSRRVALLHDYDLYEFTILVRLDP